MPNTLQPQIDGPLKVDGDLEIVSADGKVTRTRGDVWLCRCGQSATKPFCDSSHRRAGFSDAARVSGDYQPKAIETADTGEILRITFKANGSVRCVGRMNVLDAGGSVAWSGTQANFCRCGASKNKPFCDGSHRAVGFDAP